MVISSLIQENTIVYELNLLEIHLSIPRKVFDNKYL